MKKYTLTLDETEFLALANTFGKGLTTIDTTKICLTHIITLSQVCGSLADIMLEINKNNANTQS